MHYRQLGNAGVRISVIGLGTNRFGSDAVNQATVNNIIAACAEHGINFIDTADIYQGGRSEESLGIALKGRWDKFVLATKFVIPTGEGPNDKGASRYHMMHAVEASLRRLQSDHIDLYYVHRWDEHTPIEETLRALDDLVRQGKVRYVGASNFVSWQLAHANLLATIRGWLPVVALQSEYHLFERAVEREALPYCRAHRVGIIPYFPLAGGFLTGKYTRGQAAPPGSRGESSKYVQGFMTDANYDKVEKLTAWAQAHDHTLNKLAHAWLLAQHQVCSVISGATKLEQVLDNLRAADWTLNADEVKEINAILEA
ncbi:NDP-hexose C3-ketoreductase / dTDP-4-oxo-2-deoxy-alpha-D-pentos-2-ene 2,3-reductase [Anaerolineae bacterium]|nr:NDP-hexose C3-ketoreductase / dTDP-4-oxo-2-deoxy-alpha-D-pentos-2-ene 2,3-reductase [Anaerolineae bacterium]